MAIFGTKVKTVESITTAFTTAITDLAEVQAASKASAEAADKQIEDLKVQAQAARDEAAKAAKIAGKLSDLLGV